MLVGGLLASLWFMFVGYGFGMMGGFGGMMGGMMGGYQDMMYNFGFQSGYMLGFSLIGLIAGVIVIVAALMLKAHPAEHTAWGAIVLAFSIISFFGMGGFYIGAVLGIAGGALALAWRPSTKA